MKAYRSVVATPVDRNFATDIDMLAPESEDSISSLLAENGFTDMIPDSLARNMESDIEPFMLDEPMEPGDILHELGLSGPSLQFD